MNYTSMNIIQITNPYSNNLDTILMYVNGVFVIKTSSSVSTYNDCEMKDIYEIENQDINNIIEFYELQDV